MESAFAVSNFFVQKSFETGIELTPMKLIKLVYVAHGWHLGLYKKPLIGERIEAWQYGPVIPTIYEYFKYYGAGQIESLYYESIGDKLVAPELKEEEKSVFLERIWDVYKNYNGLELSFLTHRTGTPWDKVWNTPNNKGQFGLAIPNEMIATHYASKLKAA